jgi:hypothetical protein
MDELPLSPCLASPSSRVVVVRLSRATPCTGKSRRLRFAVAGSACRLPRQSPPQLTQPPPVALGQALLLASEHFFSRGLEWRLLSEPWEGRKAEIRRDF